MMVLKEEIDRIKEIMGLKIIVESVLPNYIKKFISLILESSENSVKELDNVVKKINPENSIDLSDITKGYKTIDDYPEINWINVIEELIDGPNGSAYKKILYTALENDIKTSSAGKILKELGDAANDKDSLIEILNNDPKLYKEYIDFLENNYNKILKVFSDDIETLNIVKKISGLDEDNLKYLKSLIVTNVDNTLTNLSKELKNQSLDISKKFRQKWFTMMKKVENRLGEEWKATDEEKEKLATILNAINEKTKGDKIYFTLPITGKTVKIEPQEILNTQLSNYKLIYNKDGSVSLR
jgi:division protein CdvB (Snf7/Vps24/ESCRT-III family)